MATTGYFARDIPIIVFIISENAEIKEMKEIV